MSQAIKEFVTGQIWIKNYPVRYAGTRFFSRMTISRLQDGRLLLHSPCEIDHETKEEITALGPVAFIVAPGNYHYFHVASCQRAFPKAVTYICPGIERKRPEIDFDWILGDRPPPDWEHEIDQVLVRGTRFIWEVAFLHKPSQTLILVDLLENIGDDTPGTNWVLKLWWKVVFRMWNTPKPAPEYQLGWKDKRAAAKSLNRILEWDFNRVIMAHGDPITKDAKQVVRQAWRSPLKVG